MHGRSMSAESTILAINSGSSSVKCGISANAPAVRAKICTGLDFLRSTLNDVRNAAGERDISPALVMTGR